MSERIFTALVLFNSEVGATGRKMRKGKTKMKKSVKETVREAILPTVTELGYRLWDVTYSKVGADYHLEITIDSDDGIGIEDCERVHRAIDPILDEVDPIEGFYYLEVSSPGIERELRTDDHILACIGWEAEARLYASIDGSKVYRGIIAGYEDGKLTLEIGEDAFVEIEKKNIGALKTVYDFDDEE